MLRAICLRESWMRETRTSGLTRERAPNGPSLLYNSSSIFDFEVGVYPEMRTGVEYEAEVKEKQTAVGQKERRY
jgi:hypothetical protein